MHQGVSKGIKFVDATLQLLKTRCAGFMVEAHSIETVTLA